MTLNKSCIISKPQNAHSKTGKVAALPISWGNCEDK